MQSLPNEECPVNIINKSPKLVTTPMSIDSRMEIFWFVHAMESHTAMNYCSTYNVDESHRCNIKWEKPDTKKYTFF